MQYNAPFDNRVIRTLDTGSNSQVVIKIAVAITWLVLLAPVPSLFASTSTEPVILGKYSLGYAAGLAIYTLGTVSLLGLFLLNDQMSKFLLSKSQETTSNLVVYARYLSFSLTIVSILFFLSRAYSWAYDELLQISLLAQGLWLIFLPAFIQWGVNGWSLKHFSLTRLYKWLASNTVVWTGPAVVVFAILFSALLGYKGSSSGQQLILLLLPAIGVVLLFWHRPLWGLVVLVFTIAIPLNGPSGVNATTAMVAFLLSLWIAEMILIQRKILLVSSITTRPLLILVAVACLSFGFGQLPWYTFAQSAPLGAQLGGLTIYILSAAAFLIVANRIRDVRWLQTLVWTFIAVGTIHIVDRILSTEATTYYYQSVINGSLFWTWLVTLSFSQAIFNNKLDLGWRATLIGIAFLTFYVAYVQQQDWKSGWVPPLVSMAAIIGIRYWRVALIAVPFTVAPLSYFVSQLVASDSYSWDTRVDAWNIVVEITKASPIFGLGFANYNWFTPLFPIRGYAVRFNSHSQYVDVLAQTGIIGFVAFVYFFIVVGWLGWNLRNRVPEGFAKAYVYGALGGLVATLVSAALGDWVLPFFYNVGLSGFRASVWSWIFLGGLVVLEQLYKQPKQEPVSSSTE